MAIGIIILLWWLVGNIGWWIAIWNDERDCKTDALIAGLVGMLIGKGRYDFRPYGGAQWIHFHETADGAVVTVSTGETGIFTLY